MSPVSTNLDLPHECGRAHFCSIIPPYLLTAIANSEAAPQENRKAAEETLTRTASLAGARRERTTNLRGTGAPPDSRPTQQQSIVPDHILRNIAESEDVDLETRADMQRTLLHSNVIREARQASLQPTTLEKAQPPHMWREVYDFQHTQNDEVLPGILIRSEGEPSVQAAHDPAVDQCYDNLGATFDFYATVLGRNSINNRGLPLTGTVHYGKNFANAFWNSKQMVFGDGDNFITNFTKSLDVIGHELTHGVTESTAGLLYHNQSGALNESISDVFGSLVQQYHLKQTAADADWLIGEDCLFPGVKGVALRSMKAPGTAYDDPKIGKDPQGATMAEYKNLKDDESGDYGGVHINSGIPNRAFYLVATKLGGNSWDRAGKIWYNALIDSRTTPDCSFEKFANITCLVARGMYTNEVEEAVRNAWIEVGVYKAGAVPQLDE
ncbi:hypothetical protein MMC24_000626 [Lignoscripta atroalba]|nr:hypothetical protein [Lignoscripta atroalba]